MQNKQIWYLRTVFVVALLGLLLSAYMWYLKVEVIEIGCLVSSCNAVLASKYSMMFGVPVPTYGFFYYGVLLLLLSILLVKNQIDRVVGWFFWIFLIIGDIYTIYLRYLEVSKLHHWCELCWTSVIFLLIINTLWFLIWRNETRKTEK